jgi:hypothetical protein
MIISYISDPETMRAKWLAFFFIFGCFILVCLVLRKFLDEHDRLRDIRKAAHEERRFSSTLQRPSMED